MLSQQGNRKGFTLLEELFAIFVISVGLTGGISAILQVLNLASYSSSRLIAAYLVQEGIEIVRNVRDTNFLEADAWDEGLNNCSSGCAADYKHSYGPDQIDPDLTRINPDTFLNMDSNGFYNYDPAGTPTKFKRKITIQESAPDRMSVVTEVTWSEKGKSYNFSTQEDLYNWR